jgi:RNA polymerase sigma-70 factor (ECF subfamily)
MPVNEPAAPRDTPAGDVTRMLSASAAGDELARDQLLELVYHELHRMAQARMRGERANHTLGATALVNEAYLKLVRSLDADAATQPAYTDRHSFFNAAAAAMRRILIDHARARGSQKRAGRDPHAQRRIPLDLLHASTAVDAADLLSLDDAISRLQQVDPRAAEVVRLRFFAGQDLDTVAELLNVSSRTIKRDWEFARAWLQQVLDEAAPVQE